MADFSIALAIGLGPLVLLVLAINWVVISRRKPVLKEGVELPRGNWSLPFIGESLSFLYSSPDDFCKKRQAKHGDEYLTSLEGTPTICTTTAEAAKFVLASQDEMFKTAYPTSVTEIMNQPTLEGPKTIMGMTKIRQALQPEHVAKCVPKIEDVITWLMKSWEDGKEINVETEMTKLMFQVGMTFLCGVPPGSKEVNGMLPDFKKLGGVLLAVPLKVPGTLFHKTLQARDRLSSYLDQLFETRAKGGSRDISSDYNMVNRFLEAPILDDGTLMSHTDMRNCIVGLSFGSHTTIFFLIWLTKYITENREVIAALKMSLGAVVNYPQEEHAAIREKKTSSVEPLTWDDYKTKMPYTQQVIFETLRLSNVTTAIPRKTVDNVEYKGKLFPKGWKVLVFLRTFHLNPKLWPNPLKFDPSRFQVAPAPGTFMPFGNGSHHCPGNELAKLTASVYIHHLVTKYSWELAGPDKGISFWPFPKPIGGLPLIINKVH